MKHGTLCLSMTVFVAIVACAAADPVDASTGANSSPSNAAAPAPAPQAPPETGNAPPQRPPEVRGTPVDAWGIEVLNIRLSAEGRMLDFRYRIVDPEKAAALVKEGVQVYLEDVATGAKFAVPSTPKLGRMMTHRKLQPGRTAFVLFANPGCYVKAGGKVTVHMGDFSFPMTVE